MSTDINIVSLDQNLPLWATEKTLDGVAEILRKGYVLDKDRNDALASIFEELKKERKISGDSLNALRKNLKDRDSGSGIVARAKREEADAVSHLIKKTESFGGSLGRTSSGLEYFIRNPLSLLTSRIGAVAGTWGVGAAVFGGFLKVAKDVIQTFMQTAESFATLNEIGVTYKGTFLDYQKDLAASGIKLSEMQEIISKYSRTVGTVGLNNLHSFTREVAGAKEELYKYGLTQKDLVEYSTQYLNRMRLAGIFENQTTAQHQEALQQNIKNLTAYSKILNISREDMLKSQEAFFTRDDINAYLFSLSEGQREVMAKVFDETSATLASLGMDDLTDVVADALVKGSPFASEKLKEIMTVAPEMGRALVEVIQGIQNQQAMTPDQIKSMFVPAAAASKQMIQSFQTAGGQYQTTIQQVAKWGMTFENYSHRLGKLSEEGDGNWRQSAEVIDENVQAITSLRDSMNRFTAELEVTKVELFRKALGVDAQSGAIKAVHDLAGAFDWMTGKLQTTVQDSIGGFLEKTIGALTGEGLYKSIIGLTAAVGLLSIGTQAATVALWKMVTGALSKLGILAGSAAGTAGAATAGAGAGAARMIGRGMLKMIPGVGLVMGGMEAYDQYKQGNYGMAAAQGGLALASLIPGVGGLVGGTASIGLSTYNNMKPGEVNTPLPARIQRPEEISQADIDKVINMSEEDEVQKLLRSIASTSAEQRDTMRALERLVRTRASGMTGLS